MWAHGGIPGASIAPIEMPTTRFCYAKPGDGRNSSLPLEWPYTFGLDPSVEIQVRGVYFG